MDVLALIIAVVLIFYLMQVGFPRSARQLSSPRTYIRFYVRRIISSWVLLAIAVVMLLHDGTPLSSIGLLLPNPWWPTLLAFLGVSLFFTLILMIHLRAMNDEQMVASLAKEKSRLALPRTRSERLAWVGVSVNAGIWEEIVFRGFLPWYLVHHLTLFGFAIPFVWAAVFSLILFSLCHLYQGWGGVLGVGFVGISLALLYTLTGNLLASILWHTLFDVRFSFGSPNRQESEEPTQLESSKIVAESEASLVLDTLEEGSESAASAQSNVQNVSPESNEAANTAAPTIVPERPLRGRAAREQLLRDMGEEI